MKNSTNSIRVPVSIRKGILTLANGIPLSAVADGAVGELLLRPHDILDEAVRARFLTEWHGEMFRAGTSLWARVGADYPVPEDLRQFRKWRDGLDGPAHFVEIILNSILNLKFNEGTLGDLTECACRVPALPDSEHSSLNTAYTAITKIFESTRKSSGGNVFNKVYFERGGILCPLKVRRDEVLATGGESRSKSDTLPIDG
jgi:hypothetical protein